LKRDLIRFLERWLFAGLFVLYYCYLLCRYTYSFNYWQIVEDGHYLTLPITSGVFAFILIISAKRKCTNVTVIDIVALLVLSCCFCLLAFSTAKYNFHNEVFCNTVVVLTFFVIFRILGSDFIEKCILPIVLVFFLAEICQGYSDLLRNIDATNLPLLITGHLENSGLYSVYLVFHLPLAHYYLTFFVKGKRWRTVMLVMLYVAIGALILVTQSRAAILGLTCYFGKLLVNGDKLRPYKQTLMFAFALSLVLVICGLIYIKPASAFGRFIIWKISLQHFSEYFLTGIGYGQFSSYYPIWQISYFTSLPMAKIIETQSADEVFVAYNEPLQILIELGIIGFVILAVFFSRLAFKTDRPAVGLPSNMRDMLLILFVASLFSYPLHVNVILLTTFLCAAFLVPVTFRNISFRHQTWIKVLLLVILTFVMVKSVGVYRVIKDLHRVQDDIFSSDAQRATAYFRMYPLLNRNSEFLLNFGVFLYTMQNNASIKVLEESKDLQTTSVTLSTLALVYEDMGDTEKAILTWKALSNFIPYKFVYKDKLLDLYLNNNDLANARKTAQLITVLPVKKDSQAVRNIKSKASTILSQK
jgi:O-antigen ligase